MKKQTIAYMLLFCWNIFSHDDTFISLEEYGHVLHEAKKINLPRKNGELVWDLCEKDINAQNVDLYVIFSDNSRGLDPQLKWNGDRTENEIFRGNAGELFILTVPQDGFLKRVAFVGLGPVQVSEHQKMENLRQAVGQLLPVAQSMKAQSLALEMPDSTFCNNDPYTVAREIAVAFALSRYHFNDFITSSDIDERAEFSIKMCVADELRAEVTRGIIDGQKIGYAVNRARYCADLPPCVLTPKYMAKQAELMAKESDLTCKIFGPRAIKHMGMGGLYAVSKGSAEPCVFVVLEYKTTHKNAPTIALVGKGVTFDSGGISLKHADRMDEMKHDMAGGAAVLAAMELIAYQKPAVNVVAIVPFTENMPGCRAVKPGDIVTFYNGKTAEIINTDAEGRLILADGLSYAVKHYNPVVIVDIATLTGSCAAALGSFFAGLMTQDDVLAQAIEASGRRTGDNVWRLPLTDAYRPAIRSSVADMCNLGRGYAGAITAACFLQHFVAGRWAHIDIAGTAWNVPGKRPGATGFGVRLLSDLVFSLADEFKKAENS